MSFLLRAKEMLLIDEVDNKELLTKLFEAMYNELSPREKEFADFVLYDGETKSVVGKLSFI